MHCACTFCREGSKALPQGDQEEEGKTPGTKRRLVQIFYQSPFYSPSYQEDVSWLIA
jgi:hypothetical protein